jgi:hypothetical protein
MTHIWLIIGGDKYIIKLYHRTSKENLEGIFKYGLIPNFEGAGFVYLSPKINLIEFGEILLEVETNNIKLTSFEDCRDWEIMCWGRIFPWNIKLIKYEK